MKFVATRAVVVTALITSALGVSGCEFRGVNDYPLPFTKGGGAGATTVTVYMADAANLVPNSEVKVGDVTVGSVRRIRFDHWRAKLTVGLEPGVRLPSNATAKIGQKSLLGAEYLELASPPEPAASPLRSGDVIPLTSTSRYPETEEVLASISLFLNGGGLDKARTIVHELNNVLGGREPQLRDLIDQVTAFTSTLDEQRANILAMLSHLDRMSAVFNAQSKDLDKSLVALPKGLRTLVDERADLTKTLESMASFGDAATEVINGTRADTVADLKALQPTLARLASTGKSLTQSLASSTFPFPAKAVLKTFYGDYINYFATIDLTLPTLERDYLDGTPLDGLFTGLLGGVPKSTTTDSTDPLAVPKVPTSAATTSPTNPLGPKPVAPTSGPIQSPGANPLSSLFSGLLGGGS
jgi:phospholipid/cholesterol/gamma-HCH transport system substrate-binding protein